MSAPIGYSHLYLRQIVLSSAVSLGLPSPRYYPQIAPSDTAKGSKKADFCFSPVMRSNLFHTLTQIPSGRQILSRIIATLRKLFVTRHWQEYPAGKNPRSP